MTGRGKKAAAPKKKANGYKMPAPIPIGEVINDSIAKKKWRIGPSIGVGGFGVIYSACEHNSSPKKSPHYPYVVKIEPHENGPLFVEKHFYIRNANKNDIAEFMKSKKLTSFGMPLYFGNGTHEYKGEKYRYLVLERYGKDLWSIFKDSGKNFSAVTVFQIGLQMLDVLEYIHSKGYVHADIKGANILMGLKKGTENQAYLVDFGLATRVGDKEYKPDPKSAHNGTIEYTSRDAHLGAPTMRGDLEILAYNMLQWLVGELPWEKHLKQPKTVQSMKEAFMKNVRKEITNKFNDVPDALIKLFEYVNTMKPKTTVDFAKCRQLFESYLKSDGITKNSKIVFTPTKKRKLAKTDDKEEKGDQAEEGDDDDDDDDDDVPVEKVLRKNSKQNGQVKAPRRRKQPVSEENCENEEPEESVEKLRPRKKRKSIEPSVVVKIRKTKIVPKLTPPPKKNFTNIATQTSNEKPKRSPRQVSFDSPICEIIGEKKEIKKPTAESSPDVFEDSFVVEEKKEKRKRKLLSTEEVTVKRELRKKDSVKVISPREKKVNGRSPSK